MSRKPAKKTRSAPGITRKTFIIHADVVGMAMDAAYWSRTTLRALIERAIVAEVSRMEKANGRPFPKRPAPVKRGRPFAK